MMVGTKMNRLTMNRLTLADVEKALIEATLKLNGGNRTRTAQQLDISPSTLYRRLREFRKAKGIADPRVGKRGRVAQ